jgi:hypothetical protein
MRRRPERGVAGEHLATLLKVVHVEDSLVFAQVRSL